MVFILSFVIPVFTVSVLRTVLKTESKFFVTSLEKKHETITK